MRVKSPTTEPHRSPATPHPHPPARRAHTSLHPPRAPREVIKAGRGAVLAQYSAILYERIMEHLRLTLNPTSQKQLLLVVTDEKPSLQIHKRGKKIAEYSYGDVEFLLTQLKFGVKNISKYLRGKTHSKKYHSLVLPEHMILFKRIRDKPFVLIERDDFSYLIIGGTPYFEQLYFGATAWKVLCENQRLILKTLITLQFPGKDLISETPYLQLLTEPHPARSCITH